MPPRQSRKKGHKSVRIPTVNIDDLSTWKKYRKGLCDDCRATCCTLPVEVRLSDLIRMELITEFEASESDAEKQVYKKLRREGIVSQVNLKSGIFTLSRMANDDCLYLNTLTRRCTIYNKRPTTCREHPAVGPRPGHCAYMQNTQ